MLFLTGNCQRTGNWSQSERRRVNKDENGRTSIQQWIARLDVASRMCCTQCTIYCIQCVISRSSSSSSCYVSFVLYCISVYPYLLAEKKQTCTNTRVLCSIYNPLNGVNNNTYLSSNSYDEAFHYVCNSKEAKYLIHKPKKSFFKKKILNSSLDEKIARIKFAT